MALTPILYGKNWKETFGSQFVPSAAGAAAAAFIDPPEFTSLTLGADGEVTADIVIASAGEIDWGDGSAPEAAAASGEFTHTYDRMGDFAVTIYTDADPNNWVSERIRVNEL